MWLNEVAAISSNLAVNLDLPLQITFLVFLMRESGGVCVSTRQLAEHTRVAITSLITEKHNGVELV